MRATVVVGVGTDDGRDDGDDVLAWAAEAAYAAGARLELLHALGSAGWGTDPEVDGWLELSGKALLEDRAERVEHMLPGLPVATTLSTNAPWAALVGASRSAALVVVGSDHASHRGVPVLGSQSYRVAAAGACPVAVVPGFAPVASRGVVVGVDGSADGEAAVVLAAAVAHRTGQELRVVHAWRGPGPAPAGARAGPRRRVHDREAVVLERALAEVRGRHPGLVVRAELTEACPVDALLAAAADARLVVVGRRGREDLPPELLGSVSHAVALGAGCPVVVTSADAADGTAGDDPTG